jgi:hypothetical protein
MVVDVGDVSVFLKGDDYFEFFWYILEFISFKNS